MSYEIAPSVLAAKLHAKEPLLLIDCREDWEHAAARLEPSLLIPMNTIPANLNRLERLADTQMLVVYCHHGVRSLNAVAWLRRQGIENVFSLKGGIDQWSLEIDPTIPRY
jgi:adenylyltransferase/sulfurtransferase